MLFALEKFLSMGGYAGYVWSAYMVTIIVFFGLFFISRRMKKRFIKKIYDYYEQTT